MASNKTGRPAVDRALRQLREDWANAVEVGDDPTVVPTFDLGVVLDEIDRLTPRQITTVEELEALPGYAVVIDVAGDAWQKRHDDDTPWVMAGLASEPESNADMLAYAPLLLIHVPADEKEN